MNNTYNPYEETYLDKILEDRYIYYTIKPTEQLFKQISGLLYFLRLSENRKMTLVLPRFEIKGKKISYWNLFDNQLVKDNFKVLDFEEFHSQSKKNVSLNQQTEAWIDGFWQIPYNSEDYMKYRKYIKFQNRYYKDVDNFLKNKEPFISIHWRQSDFLKIRPHVLMSKEELVEDTLKKLKKYNVNKVYISTDSKDVGVLEYLHSNLPTFEYKSNIPNITDVEFAILESIMCSKGKFFTGSDTSLFSIYILGERRMLDIDDKFSEIKKVNNE
tara:strand:- start:391 stop:1203 length:813 start_codon:yes stop_codon:yes gene_type:complete